MGNMYKRKEYQIITNRLKEPRKFIQVVMGARQTGKAAAGFGMNKFAAEVPVIVAVVLEKMNISAT